ncbi:hypothetical protein, partial [Enterobacter roggenkampii]|uniref:hypothetical protein n=1 Tax=Enterobacter roggenkampii TaxID=1812935 RepID=UPI002075895D
LMMSLWDALRMNMMISYQELVRTFPKPMKRKEAIKQRVNLDKKGGARVEHCVPARSLRFYL